MLLSTEVLSTIELGIARWDGTGFTDRNNVGVYRVYIRLRGVARSERYESSTNLKLTRFLMLCNFQLLFIDI